ncbi:MAG: metallophosphoesterase family protein [Microcoleaceae cyanobacterium]
MNLPTSPDLNCRFAIASDLHVALPQTICHHPRRFHWVEISIPALEFVLDHLARLDLDFLLLPGDLTQDGELENHQWLARRLMQLPYPVYVVPGNHDVLYPTSRDRMMGLAEFPQYYEKFGYNQPQRPYYTCEVLPGLRLVGLNSNLFESTGEQVGCVDPEQLAWLKQVLSETTGEFVMVMIHHNVIEHLPGQATNPLGRRYMLRNAPELLEILRPAGVQLVFTGHLHVQDIAEQQGIYDITTGSLVSYPHPYRILNLKTESEGHLRLQVESHRVEAVADCPNLTEASFNWMCDRSAPFMMKLLTAPPVSLSPEKAEIFAPSLRSFWATIAAGDAEFHFPEFPEPLRSHFENFSDQHKIDNQATLMLKS